MDFKALLKLSLLTLLMASGCSSGNGNREKLKENYAKHINRQEEAINQELDSCTQAIEMLGHQQDEWMADFTTVTNPREAGSYIIYTPFRNQYPPTSTGLIARLADNGQFELIASRKGSRFNSISVETTEEMATSDIVPADQALNYTADGLTTVLFTGIKADEIGKLIADNELNNIKVVYLDGRAVGSWNIPVETRKMIMATYLLYATQRDISRLERRILMLRDKLAIIRTHSDNMREDSGEQ